MEHYTEHLIAGIAIAQGGPANRRRQPGTKRKRVSHDAQDLPWTASRCNRLLRSLTSRISILQKLAASNRLHITPDAKVYSTEPSKWTAADAKLDTPSKDPAWLPGAEHGTKVNTKTYAGKATLKRAQRHAPAAVASDQLHLPTPLVKRMMRSEPSSDTSESESCHEKRSGAGTRLHSKAGRMQLPVKATSLAEEAHRNLATALESFLIATQPQVPRSRSGATSLVSMCLRKVPDYVIIESEASMDEGEHDDDGTDVAGEVYADLEALGTNACSGWSGLREVMRADGIAKICDAMHAKLLPEHIMQRLITVCTKVGAAREGQTLIHAKALPKCKNSFAPLANLYHLPAGGLDDGFWLRLTRTLISTRRATVYDVLGNESVCRIIMQSIAHSGDLCEAAMLLQACFTSLLEEGRPPDETKSRRSVTKTLEWIATIFTAIASIGRLGYNHSFQNVAHIVHCLAADVYEHFLPLTTAHEGSAHAEADNHLSKLAPFLLGSLVLMANDKITIAHLQHPDLDQLTAVIRRRRASEATDKSKRKYQLAGDDFLSQIATYLGRWLPGAGHAFLKESCHTLLRLANTASLEDAELFQALALNNAASYADSANDKESGLVAEEIESLVLQEMPSICGRTPKRTPNPKKRQVEPEKYRWEDGLCEWILKTPMLPKLKAFKPSLTTIMTEPTSEPPTTDGASDSEHDELAFSVKKPKRSVLTTRPAKSTSAQTSRHTQTFGRHSSGSSAWDEDIVSDDELMGI